MHLFAKTPIVFSDYRDKYIDLTKLFDTFLHNIIAPPSDSLNARIEVLSMDSVSDTAFTVTALGIELTAVMKLIADPRDATAWVGIFAPGDKQPVLDFKFDGQGKVLDLYLEGRDENPYINQHGNLIMAHAFMRALENQSPAAPEIINL
ncbi:hypothetical protein IGB42_02646 [Andreprevotia sp. IGB-42]|uniref:hypothetical protein n=1 Tax=Andreprevotia sp. IGB-42 TaxID=2497473 RepID=UPI0013584D7B|nr:hypothetical protein [Andreprevotia sp. IGB-42]KAF0812803.1 hypothetical protein IGB42_02646 [Andreprevotia sp. IGB-42]